MIVTINKDTCNELERCKENICDAQQIINDSVIALQNLVAVSYKEACDTTRHENPFIIKSVIKNMANGLNKDDAIILTALDFNTSIERVKTIFWQQNRYMSAVNLYAKRYLCEKLRKSGFKAKEIAYILGISENHVFKLLRSNIDFWFLDKRDKGS